MTEEGSDSPSIPLQERLAGPIVCADPGAGSSPNATSPMWPPGLQPSRLLCPWDFPGKNTAVCCHSLLQGNFPTQGSNSGLLHCSFFTISAPRAALSAWGCARELALRTSTVALVEKISLANAGNVRDTGSIPGSGRSLEEEVAIHPSILA